MSSPEDHDPFEKKDDDAEFEDAEEVVEEAEEIVEDALEITEDAGDTGEDTGEVLDDAEDAFDEAEDAALEFEEGVEKLDFGMDAVTEPTTKGCVFCGSEIAAPAMRCPHCAGFLPIAEGTIFKQYFFFLFASLAMAIGCLLPWERTYLTGNLTGVDSIGGAFLLLLATYGVIVSVWNIYHRKMIVWPVMLAALDGAILAWQRVINLIPRAGQAYSEILATKYRGQLSGIKEIQVKLKTYLTTFGPGLYLVVLFSTVVLISVIVSIFKGAKEDARRKQTEREARMASRPSRSKGRRSQV